MKDYERPAAPGSTICMLTDKDLRAAKPIDQVAGASAPFDFSTAERFDSANLAVSPKKASLRMRLTRSGLQLCGDWVIPAGVVCLLQGDILAIKPIDSPTALSVDSDEKRNLVIHHPRLQQRLSGYSKRYYPAKMLNAVYIVDLSAGRKEEK